ncbi:MAG: hypothetical protein WD552_02505 [Candidatus Paceibacterota bacterium]
MANLNSEEFDNVVNPFTLSKQKQEEIITTVADARLTNPAGDYFCLELANETIDIPKLEYIGVKTAGGRISRLAVADFICKQLDK